MLERCAPASSRWDRAWQEFERRFAARVGAPHASAVTSGTAGLHLALRAVGVGDGDEVVTSPFSFVASANAALYERARPVFADIDPLTLNLDPQAAAAAVTERTRALLPVHIFGYPADMPAFERLAERQGLAIVEDACEALGARHPDGAAVGGRGHPAVFGFYANKQITTGEGGMVTLGDAAVKTRIDSERNQGRAPDMGWLDHDRLGFNYRLSDIACALGIAQLERLDELLAARALQAARYREALAGIEGLELPCPDEGGNTRGWFVFVVQLPRDADRDATVRTLAAERDPEQALPAGHPPDELLPRALRPSRGRIPGLRGCRGPLARAALLPADERGPGRARRRAAARGPRPLVRAAPAPVVLRSGPPARPPSSDEVLRLIARVPLARASRPRLSAAQRLDRLRSAAVAPGHRAVARAREDARLQRHHRERGPRRLAGRPRRRRARAARGTLSVRGRATRTSTWRSSGASPSSPARSAAGCTRHARATTRS